MRCIKCGSRKVSLVKMNEGYSFTKGIVGQAVLGPVGAVAGINGKTSQAYHCSECGQDEITVMPDVIERFINEAIQKNDVRSLKDYKKQYPGIEWEETYDSSSELSATNSSHAGNSMLHSERVSLFQSLQNMGRERGGLSINVFFGRLAVLVAQECGSPNIDFFDFYNKDPKYVHEWYANNVDKMNISKTAFCSLNSGSEYANYSYIEIEDFVKTRKERALKMKNDPSENILNISENELTAKIKQILRQNQLPQTMDDICGALNLYDSSSRYETKYSRIEEALGKMVYDGDIRWKIIGEETYACLPKDVDEMTDWKAEGNARKYDFEPFVPEVYDYIACSKGYSEDDIAQFIEKQYPELLNKNKYLPSAIAHNCLNELIRNKKIIVIDNKFAPVTNENKYITLRENSTASSDYIESLDKEIYVSIIGLLKGKAVEGISASEIIDSINGEYDEQFIYDQLICAEHFGDARKEDNEDEIWFYVDVFGDEKKELQDRLTELNNRILAIKKEIKEYEARKEIRIQEAKNEPFDDSNYIGKIKELQRRIDDNKQILPTLGFFKRKEKEKLQWQIMNDEKDIEKIKNDCVSEKKKRTDSKISLVNQEGEKLYKSLSDLESEQDDIRKQLSEYEDTTAGIDAKTNAVMEKYSSLSDYEKMVLDVLRRTGKSTSPALLNEKELSLFSNQRITHILSNLVKNGFVEKEYENRTAYYTSII